MQATNQNKSIRTKFNVKKKNKLKNSTFNINFFLKNLSKINTTLNVIIISFGTIMSIILLGIASYFKSIDPRISYIPVIITVIISFLLTALKHRYKKI